MKSLRVVVFSAALLFFAGTTQALLIGLGPTQISPTLSTVSLGGGEYQYTVAFNNTDTSQIWAFDVYTVGTPSSVSGSFPAGNDADSLGIVKPAYDARNINPLLTDVVVTDYNPFPPPAGLAIGGSGSVTFDLSGLYTSFLYAYEDLNSGWTQSNGSGDVAAYGYATSSSSSTVPEASSTLVLLGLATFGMVGFKRIVKA